jgi:hypothetical protein
LMELGFEFRDLGLQSRLEPHLQSNTFVESMGSFIQMVKLLF